MFAVGTSINSHATETKMLNIKSGAPDLSIGSIFLLAEDDEHFPVQVEVLSREGDDVEVIISNSASPDICDQCGHGRNLSLDGVTGVVTCMTSHCGKEFGYELGEIKRMKVSDFTPS